MFVSLLRSLDYFRRAERTVLNGSLRVSESRQSVRLVSNGVIKVTIAEQAVARLESDCKVLR